MCRRCRGVNGVFGLLRGGLQRDVGARAMEPLEPGGDGQTLEQAGRGVSDTGTEGLNHTQGLGAFSGSKQPAGERLDRSTVEESCSCSQDCIQTSLHPSAWTVRGGSVELVPLA